MFTFGPINRIVKNIINLDGAQIQIRVWSDKEVREFIIDLVTIEQLFKLGEDSEGKVLGEYTENTEFRNQGKVFTAGGESKPKLAGENYTLHDSGEFVSTFDVFATTDGFVIEADGEKEDGTDLIRKFGINIINLSDVNLDELAEFVLPFVIKDIRSQIFK